MYEKKEFGVFGMLWSKFCFGQAFSNSDVLSMT